MAPSALSLLDRGGECIDGQAMEMNAVLCEGWVTLHLAAIAYLGDECIVGQALRYACGDVHGCGDEFLAFLHCAVGKGDPAK